VAQALAEGRPWLTAAVAGALLAAYRIPVVPTHEAADPDAVARIAARLEAPVALKIRSRDILHKSDVGGVALNLATPELARHAAQGMLERIRSLHPAARLEGFTLQPMVRRPQARELIVGVIDDAQFGPVILFGHGGTAVEVIQDKAIALPPLNLPLAREVMRRTRVQRLLEGYRDEPAADLDAIALTLVKVSQLVADLAEIAELDINPLLADAQGVLALDARVRVAPARTPAAQRLAIRPYPKELEETLAGPDGGALLLRPIRPEDQPALQALCDLLPAEQTPPRMPRALRLLSRDLAARVTQIDYDREMALVLSAPGAGPGAVLQGVARLAADPDNERAEVAVLVHPDRTGRGLGRTLLGRLVDYARQRGIGELWGEVPAGNRAMLKLCAELGFRVARDPLAPDIRRVSLALR
jgi:acetyltransferase